MGQGFEVLGVEVGGLVDAFVEEFFELGHECEFT